jgi:serine/threonine protein kinase
LSGANRITKIIVEIALAMRYVHSQGIHRILNPINILLDWDWNVQFAHFDQSLTNRSEILLLIGSDSISEWLSINSRYLAPECYDDCFTPKSDVFSFGLILYELVTDQPSFPRGFTVYKLASMVGIQDERPEIPEFVLPSTRKLIMDCWTTEPDDRPSFEEIVDTLKEMRFKVMPEVNSAKIRAIVNEIEEREAHNATVLK